MEQSKNASAGQHGSSTYTPPSKNIVETAIAAGNFTTLIAGIKVAGLADTLAGKGPFTVFAPTDEAFKKLPSGALDALLKDTARLKAVLTYHLVAGYVAAKDIKSGEVMTVQGSALVFGLAGQWSPRQTGRYRGDERRHSCHRCDDHAQELAIAIGCRLTVACRRISSCTERPCSEGLSPKDGLSSKSQHGSLHPQSRGITLCTSQRTLPKPTNTSTPCTTC
jgi:hypothetical protein